MCHANNEKRKTTPDWRNGSTKARLERSEKMKLQILGYLGGWHHLTSGDERKKKLRKNISGELESCSIPNYVAETLSKE